MPPTGSRRDAHESGTRRARLLLFSLTGVLVVLSLLRPWYSHLIDRVEYIPVEALGHQDNRTSGPLAGLVGWMGGGGDGSSMSVDAAAEYRARMKARARQKRDAELKRQKKHARHQRAGGG
mmetsp:Transcript_13486/g.46644  ORF Transcript_13486/g.46644 Transcript_13486/m.46644 type:complete len:121 (+) Transcript_13486:107-469(+)